MSALGDLIGALEDVSTPIETGLTQEEVKEDLQSLQEQEIPTQTEGEHAETSSKENDSDEPASKRSKKETWLKPKASSSTRVGTDYQVDLSTLPPLRAAASPPPELSTNQQITNEKSNEGH